MPRYYKDHAGGYDLDLELPFIEQNGVRYLLGSAGSLIVACPKCGEEHFRDRRSEHERCFTCCGPMEMVALADLRAKWDPLWEASGIPIIPVNARRAQRLKEEAERPWNWIFGNKTEADYPLGYVKE
jgi:hypothetical protein